MYWRSAPESPSVTSVHLRSNDAALTERHKVKEPNQRARQHRRRPKEPKRKQRFLRSEAFVCDERDECEAADDEEDDDFVRGPPEGAFVCEGEGEEDAGPAGAEEEESCAPKPVSYSFF